MHALNGVKSNEVNASFGVISDGSGDAMRLMFLQVCAVVTTVLYQPNLRLACRQREGSSCARQDAPAEAHILNH